MEGNTKGRESFLQSLFEFDPEELVLWHRFRSSPEKRRFLKFVDAFYKWSRKQNAQPKLPLQAVPEDLEVNLSADLPRDEQIVPDNIEETSEASNDRTSTRASTFGDSSLGAWISRRARRARSNSDAHSIGWTSVSEMAPTENSVCSAPLPCTRLQFRSHRRGIAINRRLWRPIDAHVPSSTIPTDQFPDERRLITMQMRQFGRPPPKGVAVDERILRGVFRADKFPLVLEFLASEPASARDSHISVFRALHALRRTSHYETTTGNSYDLPEDTRLWRPTRATPALTPYQLFASKIPLGTLAATINEILNEAAEEEQKTPTTAAPVVTRTAEAVGVEEDTLSELTASDATHVTLEYALSCCVYNHK